MATSFSLPSERENYDALSSTTTRSSEEQQRSREENHLAGATSNARGIGALETPRAEEPLAGLTPEQEYENIGLNEAVVRMIRAKRYFAALEPVITTATLVEEEPLLPVPQAHVLQEYQLVLPQGIVNPLVHGEAAEELAPAEPVAITTSSAYLEDLRRSLLEQDPSFSGEGSILEDEEKVNRAALASGITPEVLGLIRAQENYDFASWERERAYAQSAQARDLARVVQEELRNNRYQAIERGEQARAELEAARMRFLESNQMPSAFEVEEERPRQ